MQTAGRRARRWAKAISGALETNRKKLGTPEGSLGDFLKLIRMKIKFVDSKSPKKAAPVPWVDGWHQG